jgi:hypothetical protein
MARSIEQKRKLRNSRKKRKRFQNTIARRKGKLEAEVLKQVQATVYAIRKDFEQQKRIASKYYNKWKKCVLEMSLKKVQTSKVRLGAGEGGIGCTIKVSLGHEECQFYYNLQIISDFKTPWLMVILVMN